MKVNIDHRKELGLDSGSTGKAWERSEQRSDTVLSDGHWKTLSGYCVGLEKGRRGWKLFSLSDRSRQLNYWSGVILRDEVGLLQYTHSL